MKNCIAIITARGGSKRIPRKNVKNFLGKPIITYSITAALESKMFDEVMVSTDDTEIAQISVEAGASVPFLRSRKNSDDKATTSDVLEEVLLNYQKRGNEFNYGCCIYPTAPFINAEKIKNSIEQLIESGMDSLIPVVQYSFPPQRSVYIKNGLLEMSQPENYQVCSQDLEPIYHDCGQFYCFKCTAFLEAKSILTKRTIPFIMSEIEVQDIDTEEDWILAELKYRLLHEK